MLTKIRNSFIAGLAIILPAYITLIFLRFLIIKINNIMLEPVVRNFDSCLSSAPIFIYLAKGVAFLFIILLIVLIGLATRIIMIRKLFNFFERIFFKVPMVSKIYIAIKQMSYAFLGQGKGMFQRVILLEYPRKGLYSIGFVTSKTKGEIQNKVNEGVVNVFVPTTPNPTSGVLLVVPKEEIISLDMTIEEGLKLIISGGVVVPDYGQITKNRTQNSENR